MSTLNPHITIALQVAQGLTNAIQQDLAQARSGLISAHTAIGNIVAKVQTCQTTLIRLQTLEELRVTQAAQAAQAAQATAEKVEAEQVKVAKRKRSRPSRAKTNAAPPSDAA